VARTRRTRWALVVTLGAAYAAGVAHAGDAAPPSIVAQGVRPIMRAGDPRDPGLLLVYVIDQDAVPIELAEITLAGSKGGILKARTGKDGTALLRMSAVGRWRVRASADGYAPSEATDVLIKRNGLSSVALPLKAE
jgi:hypothetical protein